jgi:superfamily I DNA/RNA helicase
MLDIPALSYYNQEVVDGNRNQIGLALLRLAVSEDRSALRVILGEGAADGRRDAYRRLARFALVNNQTEQEVLERLLGGERLGVSVRGLVTKYREAKNRIAQPDLENLETLAHQLFDDPENPQNELRYLALECAAISTDATDFLARLVARISLDDVPSEPNFVRVMSLHKSKGLTSKAVYIVGAVDGIIPTIDDDDDELNQQADREEGRRLFYVALSRAEEQLVVSSFRRVPLGLGLKLKLRRGRGSDAHTISTLPNPFFRELGPSAPNSVAANIWLEQLLRRNQREDEI